MSDLMETVDAALSDLAALRAHIEQVRADLAAGQHTVEASDASLGDTVNQVAMRATGAVDATRAQRQLAETAATDFVATASGARRELETRLERMSAGHAAMHERLQGLERELKRVSADATATAGHIEASTRAATGRLDDLVSSLVAPLETFERFVAEQFIPRVRQDQASIEQHAAEVRQKVRGQVMPRLTASLERMRRGVDEARSRLDTSLDAARQRVRERAAEALNALEQHQQKAVTESEKALGATRDALDRVTEGVQARVGEHRRKCAEFMELAGPAQKAEDALVQIPVEVRKVMIRARIITPSQIV